MCVLGGGQGTEHPVTNKFPESLYNAISDHCTTMADILKTGARSCFTGEIQLYQSAMTTTNGKSLAMSFSMR